jgi:hypothetical protein
MERVAAALAEARALGLEVRAESDRLVVRGPRVYEPVAHRLLADKPAVLRVLHAEEAEITWRAAAMRPQCPRSGPIPLLLARPITAVDGACLSCGIPIATTSVPRCRFCTQAAQLVLAEIRESIRGP